MNNVKLILTTATLCCGLTATAAAAMPIAPVANSANGAASVEQVRWVCGYGRCWWRPNYYGAYAYYPRRHWRHHYWHNYHYW
jgi:hypothetical protein